MADAELKIVASLQDNASAALTQLGDKAKVSLDGIKKGAEQVATTFGLAGAAILAPIALMIKDAAEEQAVLGQLKTVLDNSKKSADDASMSDSVLAQQKKLLEDRISSNKDKINQLTASMDNGKISSEQYTFSVDKLRQANEQLEGKLDLVNARAEIGKANIEELMQSFQKAAQENTNLGFATEDSIKGFTQLFTITQSVTQSQALLHTAMDLARAKNEDLATAAKQVGMAYTGNAAALKAFGIYVKDGLTGMEAVQELQSRIAGSAQTFAESSSGQMLVLKVKIAELSQELGKVLLPIINKVLADVIPFVQKLTDWAAAHPKITEGILIAAASLGVLLVSIALIAGALAGAITIFQTVGIVIAAVGLPIIGLIAVIVALGIIIGAIVYQVITNWKYIKLETEIIFDGIRAYWINVWQTIGDFFAKIWIGIKTTFDNIIQGIMKGFNNLFSFVSSVISKITAPLSAIGNFVGQAAKGTVEGIQSAINALGAVHLAEGGVVMGPTFALVGEQGPEMVIPLSRFQETNRGAGSNTGDINIHINGGFYLDENSARKIANKIVKLVNQNNKLRTF